MRKSEFRATKGPRKNGGQKGARGALSAAWTLWQSCALPGAACALALAGAALPARAGEVGRVTVMKQGHYWCETPGDALGKAGIHHPEEDFSILHASIYGSGDTTGIYLLTGDVIRFTSGPRKGEKFRRVSENFLRKLDEEGKDTNLRCVRSVLNNLKPGAPLPAR